MPPLFHEMSSSKRLHDQPLTMILVGLGKRASNKILPAICQLDDQVTLVGACDVNESAISAFKTMHPIAHSAPSLQQLLDQFDSASKPECAYVAVTPQSLSQILPTLLENGIHVINEKPAATSAEELEAFHSSAQHYKTLMMTASQTRYGERMYQTKQHLMSIGRICQVDLTRTICVQDLGAGWRASRIAAGGGVLMDLGWHAVDNLVELNLIDESSQVLQIEPLITRPNHMYDCEDTLYFTLLTTRPNTNNIVESTMVSVTLSRAADSKSNKVIFKGTKGILTVDDESATVHLYDSSKSTVTSFTTTSDDDVAAMIHSMLFNMRQGAVSSTYKRYLQQDMRVTKSIENLYARAGICPPLLQWPVITAATQSAVVKQLHTTLSIYSKGGVIADLETEWKKIHKSWDWFSLLHSSGTNALHGLFAGARLTRGDEVIFPVYTFHATCSPAMQYGITPVFCDSDGSGGMDAKILANLMTKKTKVVIVTHMWGMPCDMHAILKVVRQWPGVLLYEDCSHAHGAAIDGRLVGTFGDGAAWSLQGPKIISGGEGGILLTPHKNIFDMALLNGHYNKRCFSELSPDNPLRKFAGTGVGFKHRSHPLANAIALQQAGELTSFLAVKRHVATLIDECIAPFPFLQRPKRSSQVQPAWYAYVARYDHNAAPNGITRDTFCNLLRQAGVTIVDVPRSTGLVSRESLFSEPATLLPHLYEQDQRFAHGEFPSAAKLYDQAIKFDVCALESQVPVFVEQLAKMSLVAMELLAQDAHTK